MLRFLHREKPALSLQKIKYFFSVLLYIFPFLIFLFTEFKFGYKNIDFVYASMSFEKSTYEATTGTKKRTFSSLIQIASDHIHLIPIWLIVDCFLSHRLKFSGK